ncbi:hypothetical protein N0V95_006669 [Ascochyta clinopodiicola]|nr:hypothetical protein N0V95_006669 [Ascochyta clinopodiicola]
MSQHPSPWSSVSIEPYFDHQSTEGESFWGRSNNPTLPAFRTGAADDTFMGAGAVYDYEDEGQDFFETMEYNTSGTMYDGHSSANNLGASWSSPVAQDPLQLPTNSISDHTLGHFDIPTAMSDPEYFGRIAALTGGVARDVGLPGSLQSTELSNVDFSYQGPNITTKASSCLREAGSNDEGNDTDGSISDLRQNMVDTASEHGGLQQALIQDTTEKSHGIVPDHSSLEATPKMPSLSPIEVRAIAKPRKSRGKKFASKSPTIAHQVTPVFPEPDAMYDFAVTDKDDVFLDPKPEAEFGTHEAHLVKKISDATQYLKEQGKQSSQVLPIPGQQQVLWHPPAGDHSIPTTPAHYKICFDLLVRAIDYSGEDVVEKRDSKEFQRRWIDREHYDPGFVQVLAKQVLDTMIDVHRNGWTYYVQDPAFRLLYHKTMYFTFRDRFNVTALVLKYSKTTCDGILKGQRLYDVIGNSYHLETRVTSNKKANSDRAIRLARVKKEEELVEQKVTKHARDADDGDKDEVLNDQTNSLKKPKKRAKVTGGTRLSENTADSAPSGSTVEPLTDAIAKLPRSRAKTASSVGRGSAKSTRKRSKKAGPFESPALHDESAQSDAADVAPEDGTDASHTADLPAPDSGEALPKRKTSKRALSQIREEDEHDEEPDAPPTKKTKPKVRKTARPKNPSTKAPAKFRGTG